MFRFFHFWDAVHFLWRQWIFLFFVIQLTCFLFLFNSAHGFRAQLTCLGPSCQLTTPLFICLGKFSFHFSYSIRFSMAYSHLAAAYNLFQLEDMCYEPHSRAGPVPQHGDAGPRIKGQHHMGTGWAGGRGPCILTSCPSSQDVLSGQQTHGWLRVTCSSDLSLTSVAEHGYATNAKDSLPFWSFLPFSRNITHLLPCPLDPYLLSCSLKWAPSTRDPGESAHLFPTSHFWTYTHRGEEVFGSTWFNPVSNCSRICPEY